MVKKGFYHVLPHSQALQLRHTCRAFLTDPVPLELLQEILATANLAPSGGNTQPWHLYVLGSSMAWGGHSGHVDW